MKNIGLAVRIRCNVPAVTNPAPVVMKDIRREFIRLTCLRTQLPVKHQIGYFFAMKWRLALIAAAICSAGMAHANDVLDKIRAHDREMAALTAKNCTGGALRIGATHDEAIRAWCYADDINTTETASGTYEQWIYSYPPHHPHLGYLYFENGRLVAIQRRN